jgi:NADH-quinone oxidoreductase subunit J
MMMTGLATAALGVAPLLAQAVKAQPVAADTLHPGMVPAWAFWVLATLTVVGALSTILRRNLISAVMSMVATFFGLASLYALLSAHFLAAIQVLVYAGAIMVLFVFVIMVLNREEDEPWPTAGIVGKALGAGALVYLAIRLGGMLLAPGAAILNRAGAPSADYGTVASIGDYFFTQFLFPFEAISILLVIAVIGAVVLARAVVARPTSFAEAQRESSQMVGDAGHDDQGEHAATSSSTGHGHGGH